jgi:hypothetical protein
MNVATQALHPGRHRLSPHKSVVLADWHAGQVKMHRPRFEGVRVRMRQRAPIVDELEPNVTLTVVVNCGAAERRQSAHG